MQSFEEAFQKIKAATGITDIQELVRHTASLFIRSLHQFIQYESILSLYK